MKLAILALLAGSAAAFQSAAPVRRKIEANGENRRSEEDGVEEGCVVSVSRETRWNALAARSSLGQIRGDGQSP